MRLALLFGAEASKGAGRTRPHPPPLGGELYDELQRRFPRSWGAIVDPEEDAAFRGDPPFEPGMDMLWRNIDERTQLIIDLGLYFARFRPPRTGTDCYAKLFRALKTTGHELAVASLNYECICELAALAEGLLPDYGLRGTAPPPTGSQAFPMIKPHGSCNFVPTRG